MKVIPTLTFPTELIVIDVVAVCGNNITHPVVFFGSDDIEEMNDFCEFTGTLRFITEFKKRTQMLQEILSISNNDGILCDFVDSHKYVWSIICGSVENTIFRRAILGKWNDLCGNTNLWYVHLFILMTAEFLRDLIFIVPRDFSGVELDQVVLIRAKHNLDWTKILQYDTIDEFIESEDMKNGYFD